MDSDFDPMHRAACGGGRRAIVCSVGDSCATALAKTVKGPLEAEVIHRQGPWRSFEAVEFAPEWVDGLDTRRLLEPMGSIPPTDPAARYHSQTKPQALAT